MLPFHSFQGRELKKKQSISQVPLNYENNRPLGYVIPSWFYFVDYHDAPKISKITQSHWLSFTNYNSILFYVALCSFFFPSFSEASPHRTRSHLTSQLCLKWSRVSRGASQEVLVIKKKKKICQCRDWRDVGSVPGSGRSPGGGHTNALQFSCLENPIEEGSGRLEFIGLQRVGHD